MSSSLRSPPEGIAARQNGVASLLEINVIIIRQGIITLDDEALLKQELGQVEPDEPGSPVMKTLRMT